MDYIQLRLAVTDTAISREIVVPKTINLQVLHFAIQAALGWHDSHLHEFTTSSGIRYSANPQDEDGYDEPALDATQVLLNTLLKRKGSTLCYVYDFGDWNEVEIKHLGNVKSCDSSLFSSNGPDMIEDAMCLGGVEAIVDILKQKKGSKYSSTVSWLKEAFGLSPADACREPSADEIYNRISELFSGLNLK